MSFSRLLKSDLVANKICGEEPRSFALLCKHLLWGFLFKPNFTCVFLYRLNRWMHLRGIPGCDFLRARRQVWFSNDIHYMADIGPGFHLVHFTDVHITPCKIGKNAAILNGVTIGKKLWANVDISIGDNCFVGTGAKILGDCTIGDNVTIGALSLINCDIPSNSSAYGIPPNRVIKPKK